jgi:hypothetical protein
MAFPAFYIKDFELMFDFTCLASEVMCIGETL